MSTYPEVKENIYIGLLDIHETVWTVKGKQV